MFNKDFYPTPKEVIKKMLKDEEYIKYSSFLEPSAGKGDILDVLHEDYQIDKRNLYCIEKNKELTAILQDKKYKLISKDFLTYDLDISVNFIIMNPPFSNADDHLLKALRIRDKIGCKLICLYPTESLRNAYSKERKLVLELLNKEGAIIENLGNCFLGSERSTNVEVSCIKLKNKKIQSTFNFDDFSYQKEKNETFNDFEINQLEVKNNINALVNRFNSTINVFKEFLTLQSKLEFYLTGIAQISLDSILKEIKHSDPEITFLNFKRSLKKHSWDKLLNNTNIYNIITEKAKNNFNQFKENHEKLQFNEENIKDLVMFLNCNQKNIMMDCVLDSFDYLTAYHKENRIHFEGWKTNQSWKVTQKVILPYVFEVDKFSSNYIKYYQQIDRISDIEKSLCFIDNTSFENVSKNCIRDYLFNNKNLEYGTWYETHFFRFKGFKKGTIHLEFKDKELYEKFNLIACQGKNWLPPSKENTNTSSTNNSDKNSEFNQLVLF